MVPVSVISQRKPFEKSSEMNSSVVRNFLHKLPSDFPARLGWFSRNSLKAALGHFFPSRLSAMSDCLGSDLRRSPSARYTWDLAQIPSADLDIPVLAQLASAELPLGDALEPGSL
jgi:hypothetical protein